MKPIQIFGTSQLSRSSNITAQSRVNMYLEQSDDKSPMVAYGTPGLTLSLDIGATPIRGLFIKVSTKNLFFIVHNDKFYRVNNAGVSTLLGTLGTNSGQVGIAFNGVQIIIVDGTFGYIFSTLTGSFEKITSSGFRASNTVCFIDSFFVIEEAGTGRFYISASYDGLTWNSLDFATTEAFPDNILRVIASQGHLVLFGESSIEHMTNTGALDFPYSRISSATSDVGLAAINSVAPYQSSFMFLARTRQGEIQVCWLNGYTVERVSTFDMENIFNTYNSISDATALGYLYNGHPFYQINFTQENESWLYDGASQVWSQLKSGTGRHRAELSVTFQNSTKVSDYSNGKLYTIDDNNYTDDGVEIVSELTTKHNHLGLERLSINELQLDCETGTGGGSVMLQVSKDNGHTWGNERLATMGQIGQYRARARWLRLGQARDWLFRFRISDNIKRVITGAWING